MHTIYGSLIKCKKISEIDHAKVFKETIRGHIYLSISIYN